MNRTGLVGKDTFHFDRQMQRAFFLILVKWYFNTFKIVPLLNPGGPLVFEVGYHPRKKNHILGLFFGTRQCTHVHHLGVQKRAKLGGKKVCFWSIDKLCKGRDRQIKKNACKNAYLGSIFIP